MAKKLENRMHIISKVEIPTNLKKRISNFAKDGRQTYGPVEVKSYKICPTHYLVDLTLHSCVEDEMGAHNLRYGNLRFNRRQQYS